MESLLDRVERGGAPLIDGDTVTFVWRGDAAPLVIGDFNGWRGVAANPVPDAADLYTLSLQLPMDAYIEYMYLLGNERFLDPLNPRIVGDAIGGMHNAFFMPEASDTNLTEDNPDSPPGAVSEHVVESEFLLNGGQREVYLYRPPTTDACPLLVVLDGQDYREYARIVQIVGNLIAAGRIRPLALAMVSHGNEARYLEYDSSDATVELLSSVILPLAERELNLIDVRRRPGVHGILGASMGGLMALYAGVRAPETFGHVISQSGAFGPDPQRRVINDIVRYFPPRPIKIWLDVGRFEFLISTNREMFDLLRRRGYLVTYRENSAGHNYTSWRNSVWRALEDMYGVRS